MVSEIHTIRNPPYKPEEYFEVLLGEYSEALASGEWSFPQVPDFEFEPVTDKACEKLGLVKYFKEKIIANNYEYETGQDLISFLISQVDGEVCKGTIREHNHIINDLEV